jgi:hypothetical protein
MCAYPTWSVLNKKGAEESEGFSPCWVCSRWRCSAHGTVSYTFAMRMMLVASGAFSCRCTCVHVSLGTDSHRTATLRPSW